MIIDINNGILNKFILNAEISLPFKINLKALVIPHIGHGTINIFFNKQSGSNKKMITANIKPLIINIFTIFLLVT